MFGWIAKFILLLPLIAVAPTLARAEGLSCPTDMTDDGLEDFRDAAYSQYSSGNYGAVGDAIKNCFSNNPPPCLDDLAYQNKLKANGVTIPGGGGMLDGLLGMRRGSFADIMMGVGENRPPPDADLTVKSVADLPPELQKGRYEFGLPSNLLDIAKQKGWKVINYKTRSTGGFDAPPSLTLVAIPGRDKDIYIQISPNTGPDSRAIASPVKPEGDLTHGQGIATVITVDKTKNPPEGQMRVTFVDPMTKNYKWNNNLTSRHCIECHSTPLRPISPRGYLTSNGEPRMSPDDEKTVGEINQMMRVPNLAWGKNADGVTHKGPPIDSQPYGWAPANSPTRNPDGDFLKGCTQNPPALKYEGFGGYNVNQQPSTPMSVDKQKIASLMNCVQCHNGEVRGPLSSQFRPQEIQFKVLVDRSMPPGMNLSADERLALVNCLIKEKDAVAGDWAKRGPWAKKAACESMDPPAAAATEADPHTGQ